MKRTTYGITPNFSLPLPQVDIDENQSEPFCCHDLISIGKVAGFAEETYSLDSRDCRAFR